LIIYKKNARILLERPRKMPEDKRSEKSQNKRKKFIELAERRTINAIRSIRVISKLGNRSAYEYDEADVRKIVNALTKEIEALKARMSSSGGKETVEFKLS
jgi:hypothetical protein